MSVELKYSENDSFLILSMDGEFVFSGEDSPIFQLSQKMNEAISKERFFIVDMTKVNIFSSLAMAALITAYKNIEEKKGKFVIIGNYGYVEKYLKFVKIDSIIDIVHTYTQAIKKISSYA